jgi:hypothetical protein
LVINGAASNLRKYQEVADENAIGIEDDVVRIIFTKANRDKAAAAAVVPMVYFEDGAPATTTLLRTDSVQSVEVTALVSVSHVNFWRRKVR